MGDQIRPRDVDNINAYLAVRGIEFDRLAREFFRADRLWSPTR